MMQYIILILIIIIIVIAIYTLFAGILLVVANRFQMLSPKNLWTKPGEQSVYTCKKKNIHAYRLHIFIYLSSMHLYVRVCIILYTLQKGIYKNIFKS